MTAPHRTATGSFGPGDDTGLIHFPIEPTGDIENNHWPWAIPSALLISAKLGSLSPGQHTRVWITERDGKPGDGFWFSAQRSAGAGSTVQLMFGGSDGGSGNEGGASVAWLGAEHVHAWGMRATSPHPFGLVTNIAADVCSTITVGGNLSGQTGGMVAQTWGNTGFVPSTAPSDLRVKYVASWWALPAVAPSDVEMITALKEITCGEVWNVGRVDRAWGR